jgi:hypothetical protein
MLAGNIEAFGKLQRPTKAATGKMNFRINEDFGLISNVEVMIVI